MKKLLYILIYVALLCTSSDVMAQKEYKSTLLNFNSGLPSDYVNTTVKKNSKLYVATQRGLCLYDGYRFENHKYKKIIFII